MKKLKALFLDIETRPMEVYCWSLGEQHVGLGQIKVDWDVLSWAAKWLGDPDSKIMHADRRNSNSDEGIIRKIHKLLDEADVVITQNGVRFDEKKLNARFALHGMTPPSPFKHIDTYKIVRSRMALTSNKLEYLAKVFKVKYQKMKTKKFQGLDLWLQCLAGNTEAWDEMKAYNKTDILALEGVYHKVKSWDKSLNFNIYTDEVSAACGKCGSHKLQKRGFERTVSGKFQRLQCTSCGAWSKDKTNLITKEKKESLRKRS